MERLCIEYRDLDGPDCLDLEDELEGVQIEPTLVVEYDEW